MRAWTAVTVGGYSRSPRMIGKLTEVLPVWGRSREFLDRVLQTTTDPGQRASALAEFLHSLWPVPPSAGLLRQTGRDYLAVFDPAGKLKPEWQEALGGGLTRWLDSAAAPVGMMAVQLPSPLAELVFGVAAVLCRKRVFGAVACSLPPN